jgi:hypothetical protein
MARFSPTNPLGTQTKELTSPEICFLPAADGTLPNSFADWLAQPTCGIAADSALVQGTFAGLMNQCAAQNISRPPVKPFRR